MDTIQVSEYDKKATDFLTKFGIAFAVELIGKDCPGFCEDAAKGIDMDKLDTFPRKTHIHGKHYRAQFSRPSTHCNQGPCALVRPTHCACGCDKCYGARANPSGVPFVIDYWNSYADEESNHLRTHWPENMTAVQRMKYRREPLRKVSAYDVLTCIQKYDPGTFENFCDDCGYDTDSRKAESIHHAVVSEWRRVQAFFTAPEIEMLQEIQ